MFAVFMQTKGLMTLRGVQGRKTGKLLNIYKFSHKNQGENRFVWQKVELMPDNLIG